MDAWSRRPKTSAGRHNAVDKVVGKLLYAGALPRTQGEDAPALLAVSGRASFEIMQKAAVAGFVGVASVSAASSLAIATAAATGLTLAAFVRAGRFTLYSHPEAVTTPP
jgi:FdhD protein